jgi:hypothetical protein
MHVDELLEELKSQGVPLKEAVRQARALLKDQERIREQNKAARSGRGSVPPRAYICHRHGVPIG